MAQVDQPALKYDTAVVPRMMVRAMFALVAVILLLVSLARLTDQPLSAIPPESGAAKVMDANGNLIADLSADEGGFIAGVARVLDRERAKYKKPLDGAVIVTLGANGRLSITDPSTGWSADLMGFGADNAKAFAKLLAQNPKGN
jgi:hypothetical protein